MRLFLFSDSRRSFGVKYHCNTISHFLRNLNLCYFILNSEILNLKVKMILMS